MSKPLPVLNAEQCVALDSMMEFLSGDDNFFLLSGYAGTGKTFSVQELIKRVRGRLVFTAPTNKATKVLRDTLTTDNYKPECRTIYSLLGLRMEATGEVKALVAPEDPLDLSQFVAIIVDEGSMINSNLFKYIKQTAKAFHVKFIFMGDAAQLPPVGEPRSPIWELPGGAKLEKVMRHDNQILELATRLRSVVDHPAPTVNLASNHAGGEGVWKLSAPAFLLRIRDAARQGRFSLANEAKAIAWRNVTVDSLNLIIRKEIFHDVSAFWLPTDRIILLEPAKDSSGESIGTTDDEGIVTDVKVAWHPTHGEIKCYRLCVTWDDNRTGILWTVHEDWRGAFNRASEQLAAQARENKRYWPKFWAFKEAFHSVRHAYAITAHRAQGSTYTAAFVDYRDILLNRQRSEAYRCLYVACTRPKKELYLG